MGKIMSVLEKYKLIEKEGEQVPADEQKESLPYEEIHREEKVFEMPKEEVGKVVVPVSENIKTTESNNIEKSYNKTLTLDEIYDMHNLGDVAITNTVFVLEGFIKALPEELPEFVKKTTVNNILTASAMDLEKLIGDGNKRTTYLKNFINDYETKVTQDINGLKEEIAKLSAIISDYHQQIKHKEMLLQEQSNLVKNEEARLGSILEFFNK